QGPQQARFELVAAVGGDGRCGEEDSEPVAAHRVGTGARGMHPAVDMALQIGRFAQSAESEREPDPGETEVVLRSSEGDLVGGVVLGEKTIDERVERPGTGAGGRARHAASVPTPNRDVSAR